MINLSEWKVNMTQNLFFPAYIQELEKKNQGTCHLNTDRKATKVISKKLF